MNALLRSFGYAFRGLYRAARRERNLRIHIVTMVYMYGFLLLTDWFVVTSAQWALLLLANALVVAAELVNTAIEATVDLVTQGRKHQLAAVAKDTAAAAVLVCAMFAVAVGIAVLGQPEAFRRMGSYLGDNPMMIVALAISLSIAGAFVFSGRFPSGKAGTGPAADDRIANDESGSAEPVP